ncbi:radical SAM protein [Clostridium sp. WILCCON 0269]|uniref:Radical SAM protein n=1 Tax=Candidatus Clostridium eludens TaxID=3381663 RepID=A0ABW8SKI3_9CLOT
MKDLYGSCNSCSFSHIYVEERAIENENTKHILSNFKNSSIIKIRHYKDVFSRHNQNFVLQKKSPKLILACKDGNLIYKGADVCESFGNEHFYYTSSMMNCLYNCEYCYLQGMYSSANIVIFVNLNDIFYNLQHILKKHPVYLCISYDTDLLAFENITGFTRKWIEFASLYPHLKIEIRTKSCNFKSIEDIVPQDNVILAWTLSPEEIARKYEANTPSLSSRLNSVKDALDKGWKVRICFDPILYIHSWEEQYKKCVEDTFKVISKSNIEDVSIGVFRIAKDYLKRMVKNNPRSVLLSYPFKTINGVCTYSLEHHQSMVEFIYNMICDHVEEKKIFVQ